MKWRDPGTSRSTVSELWGSYQANYSDVVADRGKLWRGLPTSQSSAILASS